MESQAEKILAASEAGDMVAIQRLLVGDRSLVNVKSDEGDTPLHIAAWQKHPIVIQQLIMAGADVNARGCYNRTPLHYAVHEGNRETILIVAALIARGADPSLKDDFGHDVEGWARIEMYEGLDEVIPLLQNGRL